MHNNCHIELYDYYLILDFECTCDSNNLNWNHEIIEFPVLFINSKTKHTDYIFHYYVKPKEKPILTKFATQFTGITQEQVDSAHTLETIIKLFEEFCVVNKFYFPALGSAERSKKHENSGLKSPSEQLYSCCFITDGPYDFINFLEPECIRKGITIPACFKLFMDIRLVFADFFHCEKMNINRMLRKLGLKFVGKQHSGIDDSKNIARIAIQLMKRGAKLKVNSKMSSS